MHVSGLEKFSVRAQSFQIDWPRSVNLSMQMHWELDVINSSVDIIWFFQRVYSTKTNIILLLHRYKMKIHTKHEKNLLKTALLIINVLFLSNI